MSEIPADLKYAETHEWVRENDDGTVTVGISDHAQSALGDLVFIELPEVGTNVDRAIGFGVVESVKAASDIYAPIGGEVLSINDALDDAPELINSSPFEDGWIMNLAPVDARELEQLMSADEYRALLEEQ